jgi:hypothetical protein
MNIRHRHQNGGIQSGYPCKRRCEAPPCSHEMLSAGRRPSMLPCMCATGVAQDRGCRQLAGMIVEVAARPRAQEVIIADPDTLLRPRTLCARLTLRMHYALSGRAGMRSDRQPEANAMAAALAAKVFAHPHNPSACVNAARSESQCCRSITSCVA